MRTTLPDHLYQAALALLSGNQGALIHQLNEAAALFMVQPGAPMSEEQAKRAARAGAEKIFNTL